jgi:NAD(P)-dependent dehydrogenase (short-subunit alcohol dehydrogenase family)
MQVDLKNKVALVTGAAQNIGKAIADTLATNGARVVYADINEAGVRRSAAASAGSMAVALDVTNDAQVQSLIPQIARDMGGIDILVNNAGVNTNQRVTIEEFSRSEWDRLLAVDLTSVYVLSQAVARIMKVKSGGRIINIASVMGLVPARLQCAYVAAKAGVVNLTRAMALELAQYGILTNAVAPGSILTDGTRELFYGKGAQFEKFAQGLLSHIPVGRPGEPQEIANAVLFLAAPESGYVNGHTLTVDGGWSAGFTRDF